MNKAINRQISDTITSLGGGNARLAELLSYCIGRLCLKSVKAGDSWEYDLAKIDVDHVVDWLKAALINDVDWLKNVDDQNRPKKLMKFGDFNSVIQEADKAMLKSAQRKMSTSTFNALTQHHLIVNRLNLPLYKSEGLALSTVSELELLLLNKETYVDREARCIFPVKTK